MPSIKQIERAFDLLHSSMRVKKFSKSQYFEYWSEKQLLPNLRFYLLGYFGNDLEAEYKTELISAPSGEGYIDFVVGNIAIEFAVRLPDESASKLTSYSNRTEREKLTRRKIKHEWLSSGVLVLFDFSKFPLTDEQLEDYRDKPNMGSGNYRLNEFTVLYFNHSLENERNCVRKNIRFD